MSPGSEPSPSVPEASDPYERLGVSPDASFDHVQEARQARLAELGEDDPLARSRIEAAYDAVLMDRLKERQQGRVSTAARTASQREQLAPSTERPALPSLPRLASLPGMGRRHYRMYACPPHLRCAQVCVPGSSSITLAEVEAIASRVKHVVQRRTGQVRSLDCWTCSVFVCTAAVISILDFWGRRGGVDEDTPSRRV